MFRKSYRISSGIVEFCREVRKDIRGGGLKKVGGEVIIGRGNFFKVFVELGFWCIWCGKI